MKRILLVATVQSHIAQFHKPLISMLKEQGYKVDIAAKDNLKEKNGLEIENVDNIYDIPFSRSPFKTQNINAYKELKKIIINNQYDIIHCNTPVGGILSRLIKKNNKQIKSKIIYTAHGFHFYKGAPALNWIIYYPIEKYFSRYTDALITINEEDYQLAKNKMNAKSVYKINSTGINLKKFQIKISVEEKQQLKKEFNINEEDFVIVCIGELNKNKNQIMQMEAIKNIVNNGNENIKLLFCGNGPLQEKYKTIIKEYKLEKNIFLLGYRTDIQKILSISNCAISTSLREGLGINILEAMATGTPVIGTINRGHKELIKDNINGFLINPDNVKQLQDRILEIWKNDNKKMIDNEIKTVEKYSENHVKFQLKDIYEKVGKIE